MRKFLTFITILAGFALSTQAISILSEDFNYPDGPIVGAAGSPWVNNSGTTPMLCTNSGELEVSYNRSEDIAVTLSGAPYMTNGPYPELYAKFNVKFIDLPSVQGNYFTHFAGDSITAFKARVWAARTNANAGGTAPAGQFFLGIGNNTPSTSTPMGPPAGQWLTPLDTNVTYTVVIRYNLPWAKSTLWIDPVSEASTSVTADDPGVTNNIVYYGFRQASGEGTMRIDGLRVATSFAEVAGANTAPTISAIPNQSIPRNGSTGALPFVVGDAESDPATLTVSKASTNETLVPLSGIIVNDGDGTNRTVTVTPATGQQGRSLITLTVSDGTYTSDSAFLVTVGAPAVSSIPNQIAAVNAAIPPIPFTVTDAEGDTLTLTASSSNPNILKSENITFGGSGSSRTVTLVPEANTNGGTVVTVNVTDGYTTTARTFALTVTPELGVLLQDQFAYTTFTLPNALYGATDSPWQTVSGTAYEVQTTNGWAFLSAALTEDVAAPLTNSAGVFPSFTNYASSEGVVFYSSFTLRVTSLPQGSGDYFAHLKNAYNGTTFRAKVFVSTNGAAPGSYRIGIANQANAGTYHSLDCSLDTDYFVVTRYNSYVGEAALWVNPVAESAGFITGADALQTAPVGAYGLRESGGIGNLQISNLVVSTSFPALPGVTPIVITKISVAAGTVTIDFDAGASDVPANFSLVASGTVNGTYNPAGGSITSPSAGKFQATVAAAGGVQFYRIKRN